jgi:uncharacterized protein YwqG
MRGQPQIDVEGWRRRLTEAGVEQTLAAALAELVRPSIALLPGAAAADSALLVGSTRLGGSPDLPAGMPWPVRRPYRLVVPRGNRTPMQRKRPLAFLAQIAMSDATAVGGTDLGLPKWGLLSFFYDAESQPWGFDPGDAVGFRLMWFDDRGLQRREPPEALEQRFNPVPLAAQARECTPPVETFVVSQILTSAADAKSTRRQLVDLFAGEGREDFLHAGHALGGWPCPIQGEMETECQLVANGVFCGGPEGFSSERAARLRPGAADWRLILQLDTDERAGWMWGDGGKIYVWMREQDVRARRFDRCWTILQSY